jgi:hypothetical protein
VFEYCSLKEKICPHAGFYKGVMFCGVNSGRLEENKISVLKKCPIDKKKKRGR